MGIADVISLLGGIALFLYGMAVMGDNLKKVAADCGVFNDLAAGRHLELSDSARDDMNTRLGRYGPLWVTG